MRDLAHMLFELMLLMSDSDVKECLPGLPLLAQSVGPDSSALLVEKRLNLFIGDLDFMLVGGVSPQDRYNRRPRAAT
jgi:hypothetical protein